MNFKIDKFGIFKNENIINYYFLNFGNDNNNIDNQ